MLNTQVLKDFFAVLQKIPNLKALDNQLERIDSGGEASFAPFLRYIIEIMDNDLQKKRQVLINEIRAIIDDKTQQELTEEKLKQLSIFHQAYRIVESCVESYLKLKTEEGYEVQALHHDSAYRSLKLLHQFAEAHELFDQDFRGEIKLAFEDLSKKAPQKEEVEVKAISFAPVQVAAQDDTDIQLEEATEVDQHDIEGMIDNLMNAINIARDKLSQGNPEIHELDEALSQLAKQQITDDTLKRACKTVFREANIIYQQRDKLRVELLSTNDIILHQALANDRDLQIYDFLDLLKEAQEHIKKSQDPKEISTQIDMICTLYFSLKNYPFHHSKNMEEYEKMKNAVNDLGSKLMLNEVDDEAIAALIKTYRESKIYHDDRLHQAIKNFEAKLNPSEEVQKPEPTPQEMMAWLKDIQSALKTDDMMYQLSTFDPKLGSREELLAQLEECRDFFTIAALDNPAGSALIDHTHLATPNNDKLTKFYNVFSLHVVNDILSSDDMGVRTLRFRSWLKNANELINRGNLTAAQFIVYGLKEASIDRLKGTKSGLSETDIERLNNLNEKVGTYSGNRNYETVMGESEAKNSIPPFAVTKSQMEFRGGASERNRFRYYINRFLKAVKHNKTKAKHHDSEYIQTIRDNFSGIDEKSTKNTFYERSLKLEERNVDQTPSPIISTARLDEDISPLSNNELYQNLLELCAESHKIEYALLNNNTMHFRRRRRKSNPTGAALSTIYKVLDVVLKKCQEENGVPDNIDTILNHAWIHNEVEKLAKQYPTIANMMEAIKHYQLSINAGNKNEATAEAEELIDLDFQDALMQLAGIEDIKNRKPYERYLYQQLKDSIQAHGINSIRQLALDIIEQNDAELARQKIDGLRDIVKQLMQASTGTRAYDLSNLEGHLREELEGIKKQMLKKLKTKTPQEEQTEEKIEEVPTDEEVMMSFDEPQPPVDVREKIKNEGYRITAKDALTERLAKILKEDGIDGIKKVIAEAETREDAEVQILRLIEQLRYLVSTISSTQPKLAEALSKERAELIKKVETYYLDSQSDPSISLSSSLGYSSEIEPSDELTKMEMEAQRVERIQEIIEHEEADSEKILSEHPQEILSFLDIVVENHQGYRDLAEDSDDAPSVALYVKSIQRHLTACIEFLDQQLSAEAMNLNDIYALQQNLKSHRAFQNFATPESKEALAVLENKLEEKQENIRVEQLQAEIQALNEKITKERENDSATLDEVLQLAVNKIPDYLNYQEKQYTSVSPNIFENQNQYSESEPYVKAIREDFRKIYDRLDELQTENSQRLDEDSMRNTLAIVIQVQNHRVFKRFASEADKARFNQLNGRISAVGLDRIHKLKEMQAKVDSFIQNDRVKLNDLLVKAPIIPSEIDRYFADKANTFNNFKQHREYHFYRRVFASYEESIRDDIDLLIKAIEAKRSAADNDINTQALEVLDLNVKRLHQTLEPQLTAEENDRFDALSQSITETLTRVQEEDKENRAVLANQDALEKADVAVEYTATPRATQKPKLKKALLGQHRRETFEAPKPVTSMVALSFNFADLQQRYKEFTLHLKNTKQHTQFWYNRKDQKPSIREAKDIVGKEECLAIDSLVAFINQRASRTPPVDKTSPVVIGGKNQTMVNTMFALCHSLGLEAQAKPGVTFPERDSEAIRSLIKKYDNLTAGEHNAEALNALREELKPLTKDYKMSQHK